MHTVSTGLLPNGLRVVTIRRPHLRRVVLTAYVKVGSRHESRRTNGLTHFLEHMLFRGTSSHPSAAEFNHRVESLGASLNAATQADFTSFELTLPPESLAEGCVELGRVFVEPELTAIDVERGIVREEILEDLDDDGRDINADNLVRAMVFRGHSLALPILGSAANVDRFSERHLRAHLRRFFTAGNVVVTVASPLPHDAVRRSVARGFGALPEGRAPAAEAFHASQRRPLVRAVENPGASQTDVRVGFATRGLHARGARALELLVRVLDGGMSTRLHRRICDERGLAYEVSAGAEVFEDVGVFDVAASVAHGSAVELVDEVLTILADLAVQGPTASELEKAQRRYAFDLDALEDDALSLCDFYGSEALMGSRATPAARRREALALTPAELRRAARLCFAPERLNLALVGTVSVATRRGVRGAVRRFRRHLELARASRRHPPPSARYEPPARSAPRAAAPASSV
ncbi:MAG: pitrilysin family protein [Polyangiales bacterium]